MQEVAELKEEDLDVDSPTTAGTGDPSSVLSESQYTHVHIVQCDSGTPLYRYC